MHIFSGQGPELAMEIAYRNERSTQVVLITRLNWHWMFGNVKIVGSLHIALLLTNYP
jgi:hypothetical protein